jgi:ABC-2 type transport system permease protein
MSAVNIFLFEFKHFSKSKAKMIAYLLFVFACVVSLYNGFYLFDKQKNTIKTIELKKQESIKKIISWYDEGKKGPADRPWIDITTPFWALWNTPTYTIKKPSTLLPFGIGQAEQYGYYKKVTNWSSTYDNDMVEELANPERLVNGNIDFSFMIIFLLPILLIILLFNINGLEKDLNFNKLISIQVGNISKWLLVRVSFYVVFLIVTVLVLVLFSVFINSPFDILSLNLLSLMLLAILYIIFWAVIFYFIVLKSRGSSTQAFAMISVWLVLCVIVPGAVHQYVSLQYPANLMTNYLDVNRKEAYEVYELSPDSLGKRLIEIYPPLTTTLHGEDSTMSEEIVNNTVSAIINQMNKKGIQKIEYQNDLKNKFITSSYYFNPVTYFQNTWNKITQTDYSAYKNYRKQVQEAIDKKIELLVFECWEKKKVDKQVYENYLKKCIN